MHSVCQASQEQIPALEVCRKHIHLFLPPKSPPPPHVVTAVGSVLAHLKQELAPNAAADRVWCWNGIAFMEFQAVFPNILMQYWKKKDTISVIKESRRAAHRKFHQHKLLCLQFK